MQNKIIFALITVVFLFFSVIWVVYVTTAKHDKQITLVYSNKVNYEPLIIATEKGYFKDEGLDVKVHIVVGGIQTAEALATGSADAGAMGDAPAVILMSKKIPVKIVARYGEGDKIHRLVALRSITTPQDLECRRIGLQLGSSTHGGFMLWTANNHFDLDRLNIVPLNPLDMPEAMNTGQIDAMAGSEPWPVNVETLCRDKVHELADFSGLGNTFPHVLVVTEKLIAKHPEAVKGLIRGICRAVADINSNPDEAAEITSKTIGLPKTKQKKCTDRLNWEVDWTERDLQSMHITASFLKDFGKIQEIPALKEFIDTDYLE